MKNNNFSDEHLEKMFKSYYKAKIPYTFHIRHTEEKEIVKKHRGVLRYSIAAICVALVLLSVSLMNNFSNYSDEYSNSIVGSKKGNNNGFIITALALENSNNTEYHKKTITQEKTVIGRAIYKINEYYCFNSDDLLLASSFDPNIMEPEGNYDKKIAYPQIKGYHISLNISGENIESFDISADSGHFNYSQNNKDFEKSVSSHISEADIPYIIDNEHMDTYDYDNAQKNIKYSKSKLLFWYPDISKLEADISKFAGLSKEEAYNSCKKSDFDKYYKAQTEFLKNNKLSDYISDTFSITLHYNDNTTETVKIQVSADDNGNYTLNYK